MKSFYSILVILILLSTNLYPQFEINDKSICYPKFLEEQLVLESPKGIIDPEELDSLITATMETYHIPGLAALIVKQDSIVWSRNYGHANVTLNQPVEDSTLFLMASISKTIMVTAIMQLWEDGLFDLEDNINDYLLPDFQVFNPNHPNDTITFKMLMTHTSSIDDNWGILIPIITCGDSPVSLDSFLVNYFTPGGVYYSLANFLGYSPNSNVWHYTNAGSCILAFLVEKLSGIPFPQYCRENIFNPLDMDATSWFLEGLDTNNIATPYEWIGGQYFANCHQGWPLYPVAFLRTNKIELEHFLSAYMNWGTYNGNTILESSTVDTMLTVYKYVDPYNSWGLIWFQILLNQRYLWGHTGGWSYGTSTAMYLRQEEDWGFITFFNTDVDFNAFWYINGLISDYAHDWVIPVELTYFSATSAEGKVTLNWATATETNNSGFEIQRKLNNSEWERISFVEGHGTTTEPKEYSYVDDISNIAANSLAYRLKQIDYDGTYEYSNEVFVDNPAPSNYALQQNYPNPFNPVTTIKYSLPLKSQVELVIYNALGESVIQLVNDEKEAGSYKIEFNAAGLPSGVYFYQLRAGDFVQTKKMLLLK